MEDKIYNFTAQDVFTLRSDTERLWTSPDKLLTTISGERILNILDLCEKGKQTHQIMTQDCVDHVEYCSMNNYIVTVERNNVFIYQMWWSEQMRVKSLGTASCAAWCQDTGRLAVFGNNKLTIYEDLHPIYEVTGIYDVQRVRIAEDVIYIQTSEYIAVFLTQEANYPTQPGEIIWNFDCTDMVLNGDQITQKFARNDRNRHVEVPQDIKEVYPVNRPIYGLSPKLRNMTSDRTSTAHVVLFKRLRPKFSQFLPYYISDGASDPLAEKRKKLEAVNLVVADENSCYVYVVFGGHGFCERSFNRVIDSIACDECFLHVLSADKLYTLGVPIPLKLDSTQDEIYAEHNGNNNKLNSTANKSNTSNLVDLSTYTMLNMKLLLMSRDNLVVVNEFDPNQDRTVYSLLKPTTSEFYNDMRATPHAPDLENHASNVVRLQVKIYGEAACSERLLALYREIEDREKDKEHLSIEQLLTDITPKSFAFVKSCVDKTSLDILLKSETGVLTPLGERLLNRYPDQIISLIEKNVFMSPKIFRASIASATPAVALRISNYMCERLSQRVDQVKVHRKLLQSVIPQWFYEFPPFWGHTPDVHCTLNINDPIASNVCICLRCSCSLLYAAAVLCNAPRKIRFQHLYPSLPENVPESLRLICLLPVSRSSNCITTDYDEVAGDIVELVSPYTKDEESAEKMPHLLTVLSDVLNLEYFLKCIPESNHTFLPWVKNGLMRSRANRLKQEIIKLGEEVKPLLP